MKKYFIIFLAASIMAFISCESDKPGDIEGLGDNSGIIKVKEAYELPEGIIILGEVTGRENGGLKSAELKSSYSTQTSYPCYGSGKWVRLQLTLCNTKNYRRTVYFPKGCIWQCTSGGSQHGLQCQTTWICLEPNSIRTINVDLYCANLGIPAPNELSTYKILGVTSSQTLWKLLNLVGWRKINYEMFFSNLGLKAGETGPTYDEIMDRLQTIVHNLTNRGIDITEEDMAFIQSIPELPLDEIPPVDENSQFPEYFEEFMTNGK